MRYMCMVCERKTTDPRGWELTEETLRDLRFGICDRPECRRERAHTKRIWEADDPTFSGLTKAQMMKRLREARKRYGLCIYCGQLKPARGPMGRRRGV